MKYFDSYYGDYVLRIWGGGTAVAVLDIPNRRDFYFQGEDALEFLDGWDSILLDKTLGEYLSDSGYNECFWSFPHIHESWPEYLERKELEQCPR